MVYVKQWLQLACTSLYVMIYARVYISGGRFQFNSNKNEKEESQNDQYQAFV